MTAPRAPRDLLEIASDIGLAEVLSGSAFRILCNAHEDERNPAQAAAAALSDVRRAFVKLEYAIIELERA
jgi:formylmethanofuran:tetrahydromethanopterin formyltransferase